MLNTNIFCRNHLAIKHCLFAAVSLVVSFNQTQYILDKRGVLLVVTYLNPEKLGCFNQPINSYRKILPAKINVSCIEKREHALPLQILKIFIVSKLNFMYKINYIFKECQIIDAGHRCVLYAAV
ncbi:hypothetical protein SDC9_112379 [bioreactor metagenome]|uniref:Uncharacterized protein n=1 Tax=bioreactor metagenome TaxID=1076179 RepID=A0A645BJR8_9ZZZZ